MIGLIPFQLSGFQLLCTWFHYAEIFFQLNNLLIENNRTPKESFIDLISVLFI